MTAALVFFIIAMVLLLTALLVGEAIIRRLDRDSEDPALTIAPPRPFVDEDGRSDYRADKQEEAAARQRRPFF